MHQQWLAIFMTGLLCGIILASVIYTFCVDLGIRARKRHQHQSNVQKKAKEKVAQ